jgi:hypothetical protein
MTRQEPIPGTAGETQRERVHTLSFPEAELQALQSVAAAWAKAMLDHPEATRLYLNAEQVDAALRALDKIQKAC